MLEEEITKYKANQNGTFLREFRGVLVDFWSACSLGYRLASRNIKSQYRQSLVGIFWAFIPPLVTAAIWILLRSQGVSGFDSGEIPYPLYVLTGTLLWQVFSKSIILTMKAISTNKGILRKINFPRESLIYSAFFEALFNAVLTLGVLLIVRLFFVEVLPLSLDALLIIPMAIMILLLGMAIAVFLIPISALFTDVELGAPIILQFAMYLSPVLYVTPEYSGVLSVLKYNPVIPLLDGARSLLFNTRLEYGLALYVGYFMSLLILMTIGVVVVRIVMRVLIERMGS